MSELRLDQLEKRWGKSVAVEPLSLTIKSGEFLVLLGPSGCGKTTTMRMIAGLEEPTSGRIFLGEQDITEFEPRERNIAMVFQSYGLYPNMSVLDNICFPLKMRGVNREIAREQAIEAAKTVEVENLLLRKPKELSGGQRQRVALARAIVRKPALFLMDEPLSNLDARLRANMRSYIRDLHQRLGVTTIYVTHDQIEAMTLADRVVVMSAARVQQVGTPKQIYQQPENLFVAGFVGSPPMNLIRGHCDAEGHFFADGSDPIEGLASCPRASGHPVILGIRPEHVILETLADQKLPAVVRNTEVTGESCLVTLSLGEQTLVSRSDPSFEGVVGDRVGFRLKAETIRWFRPDTQDRF
jgi:multiple sugar transport system ATP-binding protein